MYLSIPAGQTSKIIQVPIFDSSSLVGALLAGLAYNTAVLTAYYNREGAAGAATQINLVTATKGTWTSGGFVAVDGTNQPGIYELHVPDAALAAGAKSVAIYLKGAANMVPVVIMVELTATSNQDGAGGGMSRLDVAISFLAVIGSGNTSVDHNTGFDGSVSADNMRVLYAGNPVDGAMIEAYQCTLAQYNSGIRGNVKARTETKTDGRWLRPLKLDPGLTYTIVIYKQEEYQAYPVQVVLP